LYAIRRELGELYRVDLIEPLLKAAAPVVALRVTVTDLDELMVPG
jgi:hypothetical protein